MFGKATVTLNNILPNCPVTSLCVRGTTVNQVGRGLHVPTPLATGGVSTGWSGSDIPYSKYVLCKISLSSRVTDGREDQSEEGPRVGN